MKRLIEIYNNVMIIKSNLQNSRSLNNNERETFQKALNNLKN